MKPRLAQPNQRRVTDKGLERVALRCSLVDGSTRFNVFLEYALEFVRANFRQYTQVEIEIMK